MQFSQPIIVALTGVQKYHPIIVENNKIVPPLVNSNPFVTCIKVDFKIPFFCNKTKIKLMIPAKVATINHD